jgi:hypothetical protein
VSYPLFPLNTAGLMLDRYAMNIRINEEVMRDDERIRAVSDETNVNIVM